MATAANATVPSRGFMIRIVSFLQPRDCSKAPPARRGAVATSRLIHLCVPAARRITLHSLLPGGSLWEAVCPGGISFMAACWPALFRPRVSGVRPHSRSLGYKSPNEKLNYGRHRRRRPGRRQHPGGGIVGGKHRGPVRRGRPSAARIFTQYPKAPKFRDFRQMLDKEGKNIDALIGGHSGPHARHRGHVVHGTGQARVRPETARPHRL